MIYFRALPCGFKSINDFGLSLCPGMGISLPALVYVWLACANDKSFGDQTWDALPTFPDPVACGLFVLLPSHINPVEGPDVWIYILVVDTSFSYTYFWGEEDVGFCMCLVFLYVSSIT